MEASGNTPIRLAVLYICTGRYNRFWADFYESAKAHLLPHDTEVEYFVFTDDASLSQAPDVHLIHRECHGFPADTLQRFEMFMGIRAQLEAFEIEIGRASWRERV